MINTNTSQYIINAKQLNAKIISIDGKLSLPQLLIEYSGKNFFEIFETSMYIQINEEWQVQFSNINDFEIFYKEIEETFYDEFFKDKEV